MIKDSEYAKWLKLMRASVKDTKRERGCRPGLKRPITGADTARQAQPDDDPLLALYERLRTVRRAV